MNPSGSMSSGPHGRSVLAHHAHAAAAEGRLLQPAPGSGAERPDREQERHAQRRARPAGGGHQDAAAAQRGLAGLEVGREGGDVLLGGGHGVALLLDLLVGHEVLGPQHDADADAAERHGQQDPLGLRLAPLPVHDGERHGGHERHDEAQRRPHLDPLALPGEDHVARGVAGAVVRGVGRAVGGHDRGLLGADRLAGRARIVGHGSLRRIGMRVPIHATSASRAGIPTSQATNPSGIGPVRPIGTPPGSSGERRYSHVGGQVVEVLVGDGLGAEHRHLARTDPHGRPHLGGGGVGQAGCRAPVAERAPAARGAVTGLAVGPEQLAPGRQVGVGDVDVGDRGPVAERPDERDERRDLLVVVGGLLALRLLLAVGQRHPPRGQVVVRRGLAGVLEGRAPGAAVGRDDPLAVGTVAARAPRLVQLAALGHQSVVVLLPGRGPEQQRRGQRGDDDGQRHERPVAAGGHDGGPHRSR